MGVGCRVVGSVFIIAGLYSVLWGKYREEKSRKEEKATEIPQTMMIKDAQLNDAFALKTIDAGKEAADKLPSIVITLPISADSNPTKPNQEQP